MIDHLVHPIPMMCMILYSFVYFALPFLWYRGIIQGRSIWIIVLLAQYRCIQPLYYTLYTQPFIAPLWESLATNHYRNFLTVFVGHIPGHCVSWIGRSGPCGTRERATAKAGRGHFWRYCQRAFLASQTKLIPNWAGFTMDRFNNADAPIMQLQQHKNSRSHGLRL